MTSRLDNARACSLRPPQAHLVYEEASDLRLPAVASIVLLQLGVINPVVVHVIQIIVPALLLLILVKIAHNLSVVLTTPQRQKLRAPSYQEAAGRVLA